MSGYVKSLWSESEKRLIYENEYPKPEYSRQLRYRIREKIRDYLEQLSDAIIHPEIRDKRLVIPALDLASKALRANGFHEEAETIEKIERAILIDVGASACSR